MDAKEFLLGYARMCNTNRECYYKCDLYKNRFCFKHSVGGESINFLSPEEMDKLIAIVEKWCVENPIKIRQSEFLRLHPNAQTERDVLSLCPALVDTTVICKTIDLSCWECRKNYWLTPINETTNKETD